MELKKDSYEIGDWVFNDNDELVRIISDEMPDLPYEKIKRSATRQEVKQAIYDGVLTNEDIETKAFDVLEKRMYFFVPYNISDIQKAIQAGHAVEQYAFHHGDSIEYYDYIKNHKTWIILNGGTTNSGVDENGVPQGSLNKIAADLVANEIDFAYFREPDLDDALTAVCFLCDERVFNWKQYPNHMTWFQLQPRNDDDEMDDPEFIEAYTKFVGGKKISFLKTLIYGKPLA